MGTNTKTTDELDASAIVGNEYIRIVQAGSNRKAQFSGVITYLRGLVNSFTKNQSVTFSALTSGATIAVDASLSNNFRLDLGVNGTLANPTNLTAGMVLNFRVKNTGAFTLAYGTKYKFPGGTAPVLTSGAGKVDVISAIYDAVDDVLYCTFAQDLH